MYGLLLSIPIITGTLAVLVFMWSSYGIKYNQFSVKPAKEMNDFPIIGALTGRKNKEERDDHTSSEKVSLGHHKNTDQAGSMYRKLNGWRFGGVVDRKSAIDPVSNGARVWCPLILASTMTGLGTCCN